MIPRLIIYGLVIAIALGTAAGMGYHRGVKQLWDYQAEQAREAVRIITKIQTVIKTIHQTHVKREEVIKTVFQTIEKETENVQSRPACNATRGWVRRHNAAADGEDRREPGGVDDEADTGVGEAAAQLVVIRNYKAYHQITNDLQSCRSFVTGIGLITKE